MWPQPYATHAKVFLGSRVVFFIGYVLPVDREIPFVPGNTSPQIQHFVIGTPVWEFSSAYQPRIAAIGRNSACLPICQTFDVRVLAVAMNELSANPTLSAIERPAILGR